LSNARESLAEPHYGFSPTMPQPAGQQMTLVSTPPEFSALMPLECSLIVSNDRLLRHITHTHPGYWASATALAAGSWRPRFHLQLGPT
jgi:hypothetical protein